MSSAHPAPALTRRDVDEPRALVLMLHGGRANGLSAVEERNASWRRSRWMMDQIHDRANRVGVAVWLLRYGLRGWNADAAPVPSPVPDVRWALDEARRLHGPVPVVLLGHSMGGRAAVAAADDKNVTGVVALAPWLPGEEPVEPLRGRRFAAAHGRSDRITSARQTRAFADRAASVATSVEFHDMGRVGHYMFCSIPAWNDFALSRSLAFASATARPE